MPLLLSTPGSRSWVLACIILFLPLKLHRAGYFKVLYGCDATYQRKKSKDRLKIRAISPLIYGDQRSTPQNGYHVVEVGL